MSVETTYVGYTPNPTQPCHAITKPVPLAIYITNFYQPSAILNFCYAYLAKFNVVKSLIIIMIIVLLRPTQIKPSLGSLIIIMIIVLLRPTHIKAGLGCT